MYKFDCPYKFLFINDSSILVNINNFNSSEEFYLFISDLNYDFAAKNPNFDCRLLKLKFVNKYFTITVTIASLYSFINVERSIFNIIFYILKEYIMYVYITYEK
jgi:hypothetical protein